MKKIKVITENCIGCGACVGIDEEHFEFNEDGYSIVKSNENLETEQLKNAMEACPVAIISIVEEKEANEKQCSCQNQECTKTEHQDTCQKEKHQDTCHCNTTKDCNCDSTSHKECHCPNQCQEKE